MKRIVRYAVITIIVLTILSMSSAIYLFFWLPKSDDLQVFSVDATPAMIERGKYLANHVAVCIDCHGNRDWARFSGPVKPGTEGAGGDVFSKEFGFPGTFYAKNITPYGIGHWSDGELYRLITNGVTRNEKPIFPVMPFQAYGKMDPIDVQAIIAYLRTLPSIKNDVPDSDPDFPFNLTMRFIPRPASPQVRPMPEDTLNYGRYLANIAACADCHTPYKKGKPVKEMQMAGGRIFNMPSGTLNSANITPDRYTGIGNWTEEQFVIRFKMYDNPHMEPKKVGKSDFNTVMPWIMFGGMDTRDLKAMYKYLMSLSPIENKVTVFVPAS